MSQSVSQCPILSLVGIKTQQELILLFTLIPEVHIIFLVFLSNSHEYLKRQNIYKSN